MKCRYKKKLDDLKGNFLELKTVLDAEDENFALSLREDGRGRRYSDNVRLCYMALQGDTHVSADNCSKVVQIVAKYLFNTDVSNKELPKSTSAINFQSEANVIAHHHAADEIKQCNHFTYGCDGTSRDKKHYLEQHLVLDSGKVLALGYQEVDTGDANTLVEKCIEIFTKLGECFDGYDDSNAVLKDIVRKMKCLITDRASVNKLFDQKIANLKENLLNGEECSTHFLFCNAHFLLGLAQAVEEGVRVVQTLEEDKGGDKLGRDALSQFSHFINASETAALRIIRTASSVFGPRGDEKSGCRRDWLAFCSDRGIKSQFSSFRSNRFNCVFHNATALSFHANDIVTFLSKYVSPNDHINQKLQSILCDLKDSRIVSIVYAMSLFHKHFSEPYWQLVNSHKKYGEFPGYVKKMKLILDNWMDRDVDVTALCSVFDDFVFDIPFAFDLNTVDINIVKYTFSVMAEKCNIVLKRQLADFLEGGVFGDVIDDDVMNVLMTCPLTNLVGERLFGDLDFDMNRRRNRSLFSRSTNIMWKRNGTSAWLRKLSLRKQRMLLARAIHSGPKWKYQSREKQLEVLARVKRKLVENRNKKEEKDVKRKEKEASIMGQIIHYGNICTSKEDVDRLMLEPKALENIKAQINYRRVCLKEDIHVTGSLSILYKRLVEHLGYSVESDAVLKSNKRKRLD